MRNTDWLDDLARSLSHGLPRRGALRAAAAALMAGLWATFSPSTAPTKRNKHKNNKKHKNKHKQKQKRRKKRKDRGKSQQTGSCTFDQTADASVLLVEVDDAFEGKPLTLEHHASRPAVGDVTQQLVIKHDQQLVVQFDADNPDETTSRLRAHFGVGFHGIEELGIIIVNSKTVGGSINGRELVARPIEDVEQDPDGWEFADGGPPPVTTTDPDLLSAVQAVLDRAADEVADCAGDQRGVAAAAVAMLRMMPGLAPTADWLGGGTASAQTAKRKRRSRTRAGRASAKTNPTVCDGADEGCLACWAGCATALGGCCAGTFGLGCGFCYVAYEECLDLCDAGVCCPVECGNDLPSSCCCEGETCCEDNCCEKNETCWPGGVCCEDGLDFCLGECCPQNTFCTEGICCRENEEPCFGECCPSGETCRERGLCCPSEVVDCDGVCCDQGEICDKETQICCLPYHPICDGVCCQDKDAVCLLNPDLNPDQIVCCSEGQVCGDICCSENSECLDPKTSICCSTFNRVDCGKTCCFSPDVCIDEECCPFAQACGERCCPEHHYCAREREGVCEPCPNEIDLPCPIVDDPGMPNCCPPGPSGNPQCCGNGVCCEPGTQCCGFPPECREICVE